ncbi:MAG: TonB-dependent receptor, partial [Acidobacteria bacterium]|nr:TonB-dependent receptor [Acidobacteriota bacterium]
MPGATVTATNEATGVARAATSAEDGYYRIADLLPGSYQIRVQMSGFKTFVRSGVEVGAQLTVGLNVTMEVGALTETLTVSGEAPLVETQVARISETLGEREVRALPMQGRGILTLVTIQPGITGKSEGLGVGGSCCDVFSNFAAPVISSAGNEVKANFSLDGLSLRYTEGSLWGANFSPNPDAIQEVNVATHAYSAEFGTMSGPQVQLVTKGGTNDWHGTAHYTFNQDEFNALPYFFGAPREEFPNGYTRLFGATVGGPIARDRLFVFGAYEGLREKFGQSSRSWVETQAFKDFILATRPDSIAATLLQKYPTTVFATEELWDAGTPISGVLGTDGSCDGPGDQDCPDGIAEAGFARINRVLPRNGNQFNVRVDYSSSSGKDRLFGSYWYTRPEWQASADRDAFVPSFFNRVQYVSAVYTRTISPTTLNEARFGLTKMHYERNQTDLSYSAPGVAIYDSFWLGNFGWAREFFPTSVPEFNDVFTINRGRHGIRIGGGYRHSTIDFQSHLPYDTPQYDFLTVLDFADDEPYLETRAIDGETGQPIESNLFFVSNLANLFVQNTWQVRPNLTLNYGLRWENYFSNRFGRGRSLWSPVITSDQLAPGAVPEIRNQKVDDYYKTDKNNFGPRIGLAWDPTGRGKLAVRLGFGILYDEVNTLPLYTLRENPPLAAVVSAGPAAGIPIPIVYGVAPDGTRDFPPNPALLASTPELNEFGAFAGNATSVGAFAQDLKNPMSYDFFGGVQYEPFRDFMFHASYRYKRTTNELYDLNVNRVAGDLQDGVLDRVNPNFQNITLTTNLGQRRYHGLVAGINKRLSQGWQLGTSYTYNRGTNNLAFVAGGGDYNSSATEAFNPDLDWGRDDIAHVFSLHNVWE